MALLHSPKEGELKSCSIVTSQVGSVEPLEVAMSDSTLLGSIRAKLKLPAEADEAAILAGLDKLATPPAPPALLSSVRTKLGLAADSKDEEVLAKIDHVTEAAKPAEKEPEIPAALLAKQREVDSRLTRADRREFHQAVDALAAGNAMRITPAMAKRLKDAYPTEPATAGALLSAANPMTEPDVQRFILDVLGDLPAHNVVAPGATLRVAPGQLSTGDKIDHAAESAKTLKAAGLAS
jgi:hypothetical protein